MVVLLYSTAHCCHNNGFPTLLAFCKLGLDLWYFWVLDFPIQHCFIGCVLVVFNVQLSCLFAVLQCDFSQWIAHIIYIETKTMVVIQAKNIFSPKCTTLHRTTNTHSVFMEQFRCIQTDQKLYRYHWKLFLKRRHFKSKGWIGLVWVDLAFVLSCLDWPELGNATKTR